MNDSLFELHLTKNTEKDLLRLHELNEKAVRWLLALKQNPYSGHQLKGTLRGVRSFEFSINGVAYRAAYIVLEEEKVCLVFMVGPHEGFYQKAERRAKALKKKWKYIK